MKLERAVGKSEKLEKREVGKTRSWKNEKLESS